MEIRQYLLLLRKWGWLLVLGAALGGIFSYFISSLQPIIYEASTKLMVSAAQQQDSAAYYNTYYDNQLARSYSQIINNAEIMLDLSEKLGYPVISDQINVENPTDSNFIILSATNGHPQRAAAIANTLVDVFLEYIYSLQDSRYKATEESLKTQISQVETQIATMQSQVAQVNENALQIQRELIEEQTRQIDQMLSNANDEVIRIETELDTFIPTPEVTNTPNPSWIIPTATSVPVPTPTLSALNLVKYKEMQARRDQLNEMRALLQQAYGNLLVSKAGTYTDPALQQAQIQNTLALYQQIHSNLLSSFENVRLQRLRSTPNIQQIEKAPEPTDPIRPKPLRDAILGAIACLFLMGGIAFTKEYLDDSLKTTEDVSNHLHLPVLGLIGEMGHRNHGKENPTSIYVMDNPMSPVTEGFRTLRTNLDFAGIDKPIRTLEITSPSPSEGKSTLAINLAVVIAQGDRKVILLDADFRRPCIHKLIGIPNRKGLVDLLRDPNQISDVMVPVEGLSLAVIPTGEIPPNPAELLASERMGIIIEKLKDLADIVIIDTPPTIISDPVVLSAKVDGVLVVIRPGETKLGTAQVMMEQLQLADARVLGAVMNPVSRRNSHYYTKYNYYSSHYYNSRSYGENSKVNGRIKRKNKEQMTEEISN
jgi:capsular exopolysaccharide synthesis family protein